MDKNKIVTPVVFRKYRDGSIIALFVADGTSYYDCDMVGCFQHVGQHSQAYYRCAITQTKPATEEEYAELKKELESAPYSYKFEVIKRQRPQDKKLIKEWILKRK